MIEKLFEAFFRHAVLIVLPLVLIPLDVAAALYSVPPQYEAQAGMWVEQATYLTYSDDVNRYLPPAHNQRNRLMELMQTRSFLSEIANKTALAPLTTAPNGMDALIGTFASDFDAIASGEHLLVLRFRATDRDVAIQSLGTVFSAFKARAAADRYGQAQVAITFFQSRLGEAEAQLANARSDLAKYLLANPSTAATLSKGGLDAARVDPAFAETQRRVDIGQRGADSARDSLERAELDVSAGVEGFELGFRLADPPHASLEPSRQLRKLMIYPIAALLLALALSGSLLLLFALSDHSVRSLADLGPDTVIIGVLPRLRTVGVARRPGPGITRRAVGFVAGAVVPLRGFKGRRAT